MFSAYQFGSISLFLFLSVLFALFLAAFLAKRRNSPGVICLVFLELAVAVWTFAVIFEYATDQRALKFLWSRVAYLGTTTSPVLYFLFVMAFVRQKRFGNPWLTASFFIVPGITFFLALTNQSHHLIWTQVSVIPESRLAIYEYGPWFWVFASYCYLMFMIGSFFLIIKVIHNHGIYRIQFLGVLFASVLPFLGNLSYVSGMNPIPGLDWTPVALLVTGALLFLLLIEFRLFDLVPVARDTLIEKMGDALLVLDSHNRIVDINPEMEKIIDRSSGEVLGKVAADVLSRWPVLYEKICGRPEGDFEITRTVESVTRTHDVRSKALSDDRGRLIGRLIVMRDITRRKEMENERDRLIHALEIANASKDRLFSIVAHDLRSPFNTLFGFVRVLKHRIHQLTPEKLIDLISELNLKTEQAFGLLENLLGWALSQTGGLVLNASMFSVNKLIRETIIQFSEVAEEKQVRIETRYGADDSIQADRDMLAVVLRNLLSNALKYTPENGRVTVETVKKPDTFQIQISDTGIGMDAEALQNLFRIESVRTVPGTSGEKGSGLGLILCREFMERHGGRIGAESAKGRGSTFTVVLPLTPENAV